MRQASIILKINPVRVCLLAAAAVALPLLVRLAARQRRGASGTAIPRTPEQIAAAARTRGLQIPEACMKGVAANLALLAAHADRMRGDPAQGPS
jgi:sodium/bile acid cotransporter 7